MIVVGCYDIPGTVQCAMHSVTTSYWHNVQKLPYMVVFQLANRNILWPFFALQLLVISYGV